MFKHLTIILTILVSLSPALASEPMAVGELADDSYSEAGEAQQQPSRAQFDKRQAAKPFINRGSVPAGAIIVFHSENCPPEWTPATWLGYSNTADASGLITCEKKP